jgi:hypothetical protein
MACPAAERAPEAPKVQNKYRAESAGMARPDVIAVVWRKPSVYDRSSTKKMTTYGNSRDQLDESVDQGLCHAVWFCEERAF